MLKKFLIFLFLFHTSIFSSAEKIDINAIDTAILNEACKIFLSDNTNEEIEEYVEQSAGVQKPEAKTSFGVPINPGKMTAAYGKVHSDFDGESTEKKIVCCWYFEDAPKEIKELAQGAIMLQKQKEEMGWLEKVVRFFNKITRPFRTEKSKPFYTKSAVPEATHATVKMHIEGNGENMESSFWCTLDLAESEENKKAALPSRVFTELLEAHVVAKHEIEKNFKK